MTDDDGAPPQTVREQLHPVIQATAHDTNNPDLNGAVLLGWITIAEWMSPDGDRWLSRISSTATGDREAPAWQLQGYLHNALNDWDTIDDDEDDT